jgi:hypothetical protein
VETRHKRRGIYKSWQLTGRGRVKGEVEEGSIKSKYFRHTNECRIIIIKSIKII